MPPKKTKTTGTTCGCILITGFLSLFFLAGIGIVWSMALGPWLQVQSAKNWNEVGCVVRHIGIKVHPGSDNDTYSPEVTFDYIIGDQQYSGNQFWFGSGSSSGRKAIEAAIAPYQEGGEYPCYVNPMNPNDSVLTRQVPSHAWLGWLLGSIFSLAGGLGMLAVVKNYFWPSHMFPGHGAAKKRSTKNPISITPSATLRLKGDNMSGNPSERQTERQTDSQPQYYFDSGVCPEELQTPDEPMQLETKGSRIGTALGSWIFAMIWNGISWTFAYFSFKEANFFMLLFMSLFLLVGVATFLFAIYSTLQLWNPRTIVVCSQRNIYPGSEFEISWLHQGNSAGIHELSIELEGQESATYRQGTTTRTDKSTFFKQSIAKTTDPTEISQGFSLVHLPEDTMHSFKSTRNSIAWQIRVRGKIRFWPDIDDTYDITIFPPAIEGANHASS